MIKRINNYINLSILTSILFIILGIIVMIFPKTMLGIFSYSISIIAIISGIYLIILEIINRNNLFTIGSSLFGTLLILLGIIIFVHPKSIAALIPIGLGIWFITSSVAKLRFTTILKYENSGLWILSIIINILSIICGFVFILNPISSSEIITLIFGIIMIIYSISDICEMIVFKRNIRKIDKFLRDRIIKIN